VSDLSKLFSPEIYPRFRNYSLLLLAIVIGGGYFNLFGYQQKDKDVRVDQDGTLICEYFTYNHWMFDASAFWTRSPVYIEEGQDITLVIEGSYLHQSTGQVFNANGQKHIGNRTHYIDSVAAKGQLLAQIVRDGYQPKARPEDVIKLSAGQNQFTAKEDGYIWCTTNQEIFHPYGKEEWERYKALTADSMDVVQFFNTKPEPLYNQLFGSLSVKIIAKRN